MKIAVYQIEKVTPKDENEYEEILDILNMPSLKLGYAEFVGKLSHWITKSELKKMNCVSQKYYDRENEVWRDGVLLTGMETKLFAQYAGSL
jgi:hypothetical protein